MKELLKSKTMIAVAILIIAVSFIDTKNASADDTDNKKIVNINYTQSVTQK